jgi:hypothetical protein
MLHSDSRNSSAMIDPCYQSRQVRPPSSAITPGNNNDDDDDDNNGLVSPSLLPLTLLPRQVSFFSIFFARLALSPRHKRNTFSVGSIVSFVADFAKPNAGRNIYQIDPWQCKESNGTPIENSSRRSISTVVSTTNRQPCVCV